MAFERDYRNRLEEDMMKHQPKTSEDDGSDGDGAGGLRRRRRKKKGGDGDGRKKKGGRRARRNDVDDGRAPSPLLASRSTGSLYKPTVPRPFRFSGTSRLLAGTEGNQRRAIFHENVWWPPDAVRPSSPLRSSSPPRPSSSPLRPQSARPSSSTSTLTMLGNAARRPQSAARLRPASERLYTSTSLLELPRVG